MFSWVTVPRATPGSHSRDRLADVAARVEVEVGLGVVAHHAGLGGQHGDEGQHGQDRVVDDGPQPAGRAESVGRATRAGARSRGRDRGRLGIRHE